MIFNKVLAIFPCVAGAMAMDCSDSTIDMMSATEKMAAKIPDVSTILPPVNQYVTKMQRVIERYKDVYKKISDADANQRIANAKKKVLDFYAGILGVELFQVEKYSENFTTEQYLLWVAKETINNGVYEFAENEDLLFDSCMQWNDVPNENTHKKECYTTRDFYSNSKTKFPKLEKVPECFGIYVPYNEPYFEALIVHETGHVLDYAYRILKNIRSKTCDSENQILCKDAVSVFLETLYTIKNDSTRMLYRLTDLYSMSFSQQYRGQIKAKGMRDKQQSPETYKKISELSNVECYRIWEHFGKVTPEQFMQETIQKYPELSFIYDIWQRQISDWNIPTWPTTLISRSWAIASKIPTILNIYKSKQEDVDMGDQLSSYAQYVPHGEIHFSHAI